MKTDWLVKYLLSLIGWEGTIYQLREWVRKRRFSLAGISLAELIRQRRIACQAEPVGVGGRAEEGEVRAVEARLAEPAGKAYGPYDPLNPYDPGEELVVWATLIQLKAESLLPAASRPGMPAEDDADPAMAARAEEDEEGEAEDHEAGFDPAAWRRWVEGAREIQAAAQALAACREQAALRFPRGGLENHPVQREYLRPVGRAHVAELAAAWRRVAARIAPARMPAYRSEPSWRLILPQLVRWLRERREAILEEWARRLDKPQQVAAFLAFLELVRRGRVIGVQEGPGRPIRLVWAARTPDRNLTLPKPPGAEQEVS
ncbi:MAG: hypothetical protein IMX00_03095 [Limnochordales bacterium]|nr:hypothetical protein [Limnochordales bacterium]